MPHRRTPSIAEVLAAHLAICLLRFSAEASSPCCRVPIFKSNTHGRRYDDVMFSIIRKSVNSTCTVKIQMFNFRVLRDIRYFIVEEGPCSCRF